MIDESTVYNLCKMYGLEPKIFQATDTIQIDTPLDSWRLILLNRKIKPIKITHQNKFKDREKYHFQRCVSTIQHAIDSIATHKGWLKRLHAIPNTYNQNNNINKGV